LKLQQDELARTPKITRSTLLPSVCQNHVATGVLLVLGTNTTSNLNTYTHSTVETTREPAVWRGRLDRVWGAVRPPPPGNQEILRNTSSEHQNAPRFHQQKSLVKGQASYQEILAKMKTSPRGLGAVRPATKGSLTSCTQQLQARTPRKQHENDPRFHLNAPLIKANKLTEENLAKSKPSPGRPRAVRPPS
jgi:hypothetical protein